MGTNGWRRIYGGYEKSLIISPAVIFMEVPIIQFFYISLLSAKPPAVDLI
jgi:hypothetical protein